MRQAVCEVGRQKEQVVAEVRGKWVGCSSKYRSPQARKVDIARSRGLAVDTRIIACDGPAPAAEQMVDRPAGLERVCLAFAFQWARAIEIAIDGYIGAEWRERAGAGQDEGRARQAE